MSLALLWRVDDGLDRRCVEVKAVDGLVAHGVEYLAVHSIEMSLYLVHVDNGRGYDEKFHVLQLERRRPPTQFGLECLHFLDVLCVVYVIEELVQKNGYRAALEPGLVTGGRRSMQELVRDVHAVRLEIRKTAKPGAARIVDIAQPCLEYAMAEKDVCRAYALVEPFTNCLVCESDVLRHLALHGNLDAGFENHDVRHRRTANPLAVEKRVRGELKELERTDGVEVGEMPVKKSPDPT